MSFVPVLYYVTGLGTFGFIYWLLDGILDTFIETGVYTSSNTWDLLLYLWIAIIFVYIIFGGIWLIRKYNEKEYIEY